MEAIGQLLRRAYSGTLRIGWVATEVKAQCPTCGPNRNAHVITHHRDVWKEPDRKFDCQADYHILRCLGCGAVYFRKEEHIPPALSAKHTSGPKIIYWPAPSQRAAPGWVEQLSKIDEELY